MRYDKTFAILITGFVSPLVGAQSNVDPTNKWAWAENVGWTNWQHDAPNPGDGVLIEPGNPRSRIRTGSASDRSAAELAHSRPPSLALEVRIGARSSGAGDT